MRFQPHSSRLCLTPNSEHCSTPPTTPLDELALKRHRFFSDLIDSAHMAIEQRVKLESLGHLVTEVAIIEPDVSLAPPNSKLQLNKFNVDARESFVTL